jgi:rhamnogalacturonyl hydrolase YesR
MKLHLLLALLLALPAAAQEKPAAPDLSGKTDDSIREVLRVVARHQLHPLKDGDYTPVATLAAAEAARPPEGIMWSYPWGVTLYGVIRSTDATGDREALDFALEHNRIDARYYAWLEGVHQKLSAADWDAFARRTRVRGLLLLGNLDNCGAMGVQTLEGILRHRDQMIPEQNAVVARIADWIANKQARLPDGTFWRPTETNQSRFMEPGTLWIDDLYMGCPYLIRWAKFSGDDKYLHDAANNVINMAARMQDTDGVWFHAYFEHAKKHNPWKWGRANGWAMVATAEILSALPENHPDREKLLDVFRRHVAGVKALQPASGVWHQVLNRQDLWEETSCTAMFAYSIARGVNRGWLPASDMDVARKAFAGICANYITPQGVVKGTCEGTGIGLDLEFYMNRRRPDDDLHGRGVVLLAGTEILNPSK